MDRLTSRAFSFLRFPLIVAVIVIHCNLLVKNPELEAKPVFYFLFFVTMKLVCLAVPLFFLMSGYLFFKEGYLDCESYKKKLARRVQTVLIPYLLWNVVYLVILGLMQLIKPDTLFILHKHIAEFRWQDFLWIFWDISQITGLVDDQRACLVGAFWFLQCLFVLFLVSPIIYIVIKYLRHLTLLLIGVFYFTDLIPILPGIHYNAITFYMLGAYLSIMRIDFMGIVKRIPVYVDLLMIMIAVLISYHLRDNELVYKVTDVLLYVAVFGIVAYIIEKWQLRENKYLVSSVFFVFAIHRLFSAFLMTVSSHVVPSIENDFVLYGYYLLMVLLTVVLSLSVYQIALKLVPKTTAILNGHRNN